MNTIGTVEDATATEKSMIKMMDKFNINIEDIRTAFPAIQRF